MTTAIATTEHRSSGQIGQPAACMIENSNPDLSATGDFWTRDYGLSASRGRPAKPVRHALRAQHLGGASVGTSEQSTATVDNFVGKWQATGPGPRKRKARNGLLKT
jgi:hypothetical protein